MSVIPANADFTRGDWSFIHYALEPPSNAMSNGMRNAAISSGAKLLISGIVSQVKLAGSHGLTKMSL